MKVNIYSCGLVACSVCAPTSMTKQEVIDEVNRINPTGVSSQWDITQSHFRGGQPNGYANTCEGKETYHWLLTC